MNAAYRTTYPQAMGHIASVRVQLLQLWEERIIAGVRLVSR